MKEKIIGIGGGVGPMAGLGLHQKIIEQTQSGGTDQGHISVYHLSCAADITDRTAFLLGKIQENPGEGMCRVVQAMEKAATFHNKEIVVGIPCNTFHVPLIFTHFLALLKQNNSAVQIIHMLEETAEFIASSYPTAKKVGLLSTTGTRELQVYKNLLTPLGFELIEVPDNIQTELQDTIYNTSWGIKAQNPVSSKARNNFLRFSKILKDKGAEIIILGCTEIPLALPAAAFEGIQLIDPVFVLARALVRVAAKEKLKKMID